MRGRILLAFLFFMFTAGYTEAQQYSSEGKSFYLSSVPSLLVNASCDVTISSRSNTTVTLENPAQGYKKTLSLTANTPVTEVIPSGVIIPSNNDVVSNHAVHITADDPISVYTMNYGAAIADGAMVLPELANGSEYYVASFTGLSTAAPSEFIVVGLEDSVSVIITPSVETRGGHKAGASYKVKLLKGQTYLELGKDTLDLTSTFIREENGKRIAVFSGTKCVNIPNRSCPACDVLMEQMVPLNVLGKKYLMAPLADSKSAPAYSYRVIATKDSTDVAVNGNKIAMLNTGEVFTRFDEKAEICITATQPVMAVQYMQGASCVKMGDPSMVVIPPVEQMVTRVNYATAGYSGFVEHYVYILLKSTAAGTLKINGDTVAKSSYFSFSGCSEYAYATLKIDPGNHLIECDSGFLMIAYGYGLYISYAYIGGTDFRNLQFATKVEGLECNSLSFDISLDGDVSFVTSSLWDFGDGTSATGLNVKKTYSKHDTYQITNTINVGGTHPYSLVRKDLITTLQSPVADIAVNQLSNCEKQNMAVLSDSTRYRNGSAKNKTIWYFSDTTGIVFDSSSITKKYKKAGTYLVKLKTWASNGCTDTAIRYITVLPSAKAAYQQADTQCYNKNLFHPAQLSFIPSPETITGYNWLFSDNTKDTGASPLKKFNDTGVQTVTLVAQASNGCNDTLTRNFMILPAPNAAFTASNTCHGHVIKPVNGSSSQKGALHALWLYDDGTYDTLFDAEKLFGNYGFHTISLMVQAENSCIDSIGKTISVYPRPSADFSFNTLCTGISATFTDNSQRTAPVKENRWTTGDGGGAINTGDFIHAFNTTSAWKIKLVTIDTNGCADSIVKMPYINPPPVVAFTINDSTQCLGSEFVFDSESWVANTGIKSQQWLFNGTYFSAQPYTKLIPSQPGSFRVKLKIVSDSMCADSLEKTITVQPQPALAIDVNDTSQCERGNSFVFTNNTPPLGGNTHYTWIFSTRDTLTGSIIPPKSFIQPGRYRVQVQAITDDGCTDKTELYLKVNFNPLLNFKVKEVCQNDSAFFENLSAYSGGSSAKWMWDFGDGFTSKEKEPLHMYSAPGVYTVSLTGVSSEGCSDTLVLPNSASILPAPHAYFIVDQYNHYEDKIRVVFENKTTNGNYYFWAFGNGQYSPDKNAVTTFEDTGRYAISLSASNTFNCYDNYDTVIYLVPRYEVYVPNAFTPNKDPLNPVFKIEGTYYYRAFEMKVFNRWGEVLFTTYDPKTGWNGIFKDEPAPDGTYVYSIRMESVDGNVHIMNGTFILLR